MIARTKILKAMLFTVLLLPAFAYAGVDKNSVITATDQILYEAQKREALSIGGNYDAVWDTTVTITAGSSGGDTSTRKRIALSLKANTYLKSVVMYTNEDVYMRFLGSGINAKYAGVDSTGYFILRAGRSLNLEVLNLSSIAYFGNGTTAATVDILALGSRDKPNSPVN